LIVLKSATTEDPATVATAVANILAAPNAGLPREIAEVECFASAVRRVLEADLPADVERRILAVLARRAARTALPLLTLAAIEREILPEEGPALPPRDWEAAQRRLGRAGYSSCPLCCGAVAGADEIRRISERRRATSVITGGHRG
jgi:hypothetical protein